MQVPIDYRYVDIARAPVATAQRNYRCSGLKGKGS